MPCSCPDCSEPKCSCPPLACGCEECRQSPRATSPLPYVEVYAASDAGSLEQSCQISLAISNRFIHAASFHTTKHSMGPSTDLPHVYINNVFVGGQTELDQFLGIQELTQQSNIDHKRLFLVITLNWCRFCSDLKEFMHWYDSDGDGLQTYTTKNTRTLCLPMTEAFQRGVLITPPDIEIKYPTILEYMPDGTWVQIDVSDFKKV